MFRNAFDTQPNVRAFTWQQLKDGWASTRRTADKESRTRDIGLMSAALFDPPYRKKENVTEVSVLILDVDIGVSADQILVKLKGYDTFVVETFHSTPEAPRWRVLVRLVRPIAAEDYDQAWARVNRLLGGWLDPATKDSSRMLFLTCAPPDAPKRRWFAQEGDGLDWRTLPAPKAPKPRVRTGSTQPARHEDRRAAGMLAKWVDELSQQVPGSRRARLMQVADAAGGLVANGLLDAHNAREALLAACDVNGLTAAPSAGGDGEQATERALDDAMAHGEAAPWTPADFGDRKDWQPSVNGSARLGQRNGHVTREVLEPLEPEPLPAIPKFPIDMLSPLWNEYVRSDSLSPSMLLGPAFGVTATAIGGESVVEIDAGRYERAVLWLAWLSDAGTGKNGALRRARAIVDRYYTRERGLQSPTSSQPILQNASTIEALMADLGQMQEEAGTAALGIAAGELSAFLEGLGQYKRTGNSFDRSIALDLFSADAPMTYRRRGDGRSKRNKIDLYIEKPTVCIFGGIVPQNQHLLGSSTGDGMRSRWLPFLIEDLGPDVIERDDGVPPAWEARIEQLLDARAQRRVWMIRGEARELFDEILRRWRREAYEPGLNIAIKAALMRGSVYLARLSLVLAEFEWPARGGEIPRWIVEAAGGIMCFCIDCWHALGEGDTGGLSQRTSAINKMILGKLIPALESVRHGEGRILQRELQRRRIPCRGVQDFHDVMQAYAEQYGGERVVRHEKVGKATQVWVYPPPRASATIRSDDDAG